jgi:glycosyltransferase involved in cell wall biosynthesis
MKSKPYVSVLIPVFNCQGYVLEAINSILKQTFTDFELIVIDDGSTDGTRELLETIHDKRVKIFFNEKNMGQPYSRNKGIEIANGNYIAQLDADDVATPDRLEKQLLFFKNHSDCAILGSFEGIIDGNSRLKLNKIISRYIKPDYIYSSLLFLYSTITHRSVMAKSEVLKQFKYNEEYVTCQDYDLFSRICLAGFKLYNINEILVFRREHSNRITHNKWRISFEKRTEIAKGLLKKLQINFNEDDLIKHVYLRKLHIMRDLYKIDFDYLKWAEKWLLKLICANNKYKIYPVKAFKSLAGKCWRTVYFNGNFKVKKQSTQIFIRSKLFRYALFSLKTDFTQLYINQIKCNMKLKSMYKLTFKQIN